MTEAALTIDDLTVAFHHHPAVHHLSGTVARGSLTAIVGPNGAGKSTLLEALMGRLPLTAGRFHISPDMARQLAYLPQQAAVERSVPITVRDFVSLGHWSRAGAFAALGDAALGRCAEVLQGVGLAGFERRLIGELSAGQFQRVLFARLMLQDAQLILLDEPFNAIDARTSADLLRLVLGWHDEGRTLLVVLHDLELVREHFPHTLLLAREAVAWGPTGQVLRAEHLFRARQMAEQWDEAAPSCERESA